LNAWPKILIGSLAAAALSAAVEWRVAPVAFVAAVITFSPLARRKRLWFVGDVESEYAIVSRRREEALRALKDLEDDKLAGKLPQADFERLRPGYLQTAKELTAQLDKINERRTNARKRIEKDLADELARTKAPE
jgi:hypothetical protein